MFSSQPAVSANGTLTFTTAANANGVAVVTVSAHDNGGTANGGDDTSDPQTFTITVSGDNDAPVAAPDSYTIAEDQVLGVDANGFNGVQGLLFNDVDPDSPTLTAVYLTNPTNGTLLPHANGSFSYTPNPHFNGVDSFTYRASDGNATSNIVTVTLTVTSVNDAPSFIKGPNQGVPMNAPAQTVPNWASLVSAGPASESGESVNFIVSNDNTQLFTAQPAVSAAGTLTFTPRSNREGVANVTVQIHDNGGTANGGVDTSAAQTFTITISSAIQTFIVINTNDSGAGSLRAAITSANLNPSPDQITFNIPGGGVRTITPLTALPTITQPVTINATSQPGFSGTPLVELDGTSAGAGVNGLHVLASNVTIRGFIVNRFQNAGIFIDGANNVVAGNYVGTNSTGTAALPNGRDGVFVHGAPNVIGGSTASDRNLLSGNGRHGAMVSNTSADGNTIRGNYIGTNAAGTAAVGNTQAGVWIEMSGAVAVGGDTAGQGNVISGNGANGVHLYICSPPVPCTGATVAGNKIGTNAAGSAALGNTRNGIEITNSPNHTIRNNQISGNGNPLDTQSGDGIVIIVPTLAQDPQAEQKYGTHTITGNVIGANAGGTAAIANTRFGVMLAGATKATIGGSRARRSQPHCLQRQHRPLRRLCDVE